MKVAVIPARGGSKRIPRKNVRDFCGRPMLAWSLDAALSCGLFDRVVVSTDDAEVAEVARHYGAEVPFLRPAELSGDFVGTMPVIRHAAEWLLTDGTPLAALCCLYATAPFVTAADLCRGAEILETTGADYAFTVTSFPFPIQRAVRITAAGRVEMLHPEMFALRSQDLEEAYHDAGQFYWGRTAAWLSGVPVFSTAAAPVVLPRHQVQDIDTPEDWHRAELMFRAWRGDA